jgi:hypothetical protein
LNTARFEKQVSGIRIGGEMRKAAEISVPIRLFLVKLPKRFKFANPLPVAIYVLGPLATVLGERHNGAAMPPQTAQVEVNQEVWKTHSVGGAVVDDELNVVQAFVSAKQIGGTAVPATEKTLDLAGVL